MKILLRDASPPLLALYVVCLSVAADDVLAEPATAVQPKHSYRLTQAERGAESVTIIEGGPDAVTFDITSKSGIGRLVITPLASDPSKRGGWSTRVTLRLHLQQLAFIQLDNGKHTITSESLRGPKPRATYVTPSGESAKQRQKSEVTQEHPLFLPIRRLPRAKEDTKKDAVPQGKAADRLDAHFEVQIPQAFLTDSPREIRVRWIDVYRG